MADLRAKLTKAVGQDVADQCFQLCDAFRAERDDGPVRTPSPAAVARQREYVKKLRQAQKTLERFRADVQTFGLERTYITVDRRKRRLPFDLSPLLLELDRLQEELEARKPLTAREAKRAIDLLADGTTRERGRPALDLVQLEQVLWRTLASTLPKKSERAEYVKELVEEHGLTPPPPASNSGWCYSVAAILKRMRARGL